MLKLDDHITRQKLKLSLNEFAVLIEIEKLQGNRFNAEKVYTLLGFSKPTLYNYLNTLTARKYVSAGYACYEVTALVYEKIKAKSFKELNFNHNY